jgi:HPt (histidine-containing phosphotransfer) domain-containing protein
MNLTPRSLVALDSSVLTGIVGENLAMRERLLKSFMEEAEHKLEELHEASEAGRLAELKTAAHQLQGAARIVGAQALAEIARLLEGVQEGATGEQAVALQLCSELESELERFKGAVSAEAAL